MNLSVKTSQKELPFDIYLHISKKVNVLIMMVHFRSIIFYYLRNYLFTIDNNIFI